MKTRFICVALLLPLMLTACVHKPQQAATQPLAPPIMDNPPPKPTPTPTDLPPPVVTVPSQTPPANTAEIKTPDQPLKPKVHHRKPANKDTEQASNATPEVSAIGQLSPGDPPDLQDQTKSSIESTERALNSMTRTLNQQETKTVAQIREFLKQAKDALATGDVDGAHTLALKAKVLLGEISQ
ncbi:MAG TPA: hypothetical protein VMU48_22215 [Terracidiphilus sp.]|nr:hypothetical protein [Terracidiphilus sp.]